ncbi:NAD+ kinase [Pseudidiomarina planktonica]|uniref:NAD kinase n=1 Tax=Pseudidiomarina planktonica TaxID=1323738 RepID=A0A1Y6EQN7_9GAMM|nr:NAD(+) kinase [Pseudidiomarina planktonica]RUO65689.1 NAD(+) kinase [Pseudidiomarina planktonica]SMQ63501.1 NAD+ kinase [Pseudidiomarina planktonica]
MTTTPFKTIALIGKANHDGTRDTLATLQHHLNQQGFEVIIEQRTARQFELADKTKTCALEEIGKHADLAVVVGGDGNMLGAARVLCESDIGVIGVNRGNLGFLTELDPKHALAQLDQVLAGNYLTENRFLLTSEVYSKGELTGSGRAINEVVLHSDKVAHMVEFEVFVDDHFVYSQRSDGLIVATPTGSTAYSLSGGGPILTPELDAISMVPMFPHTLSSRPIVVSGESRIRLRAAIENDQLQISCDGHARMTVNPGDEVIIKKHKHKLRLIQPINYSYFNVLRNKLNWGSRLF